jgi:hypothetical protein
LNCPNKNANRPEPTNKPGNLTELTNKQGELVGTRLEQSKTPSINMNRLQNTKNQMEPDRNRKGSENFLTVIMISLSPIRNRHYQNPNRDPPLH